MNKKSRNQELMLEREDVNLTERPLTFALLVPSFVTLISLCLGLSAIRYAFHQDFTHSATLILISAILDGVDGRLARFLNSTSDFGAQLDSLADFVNFGVVPGFVLYFWLNSFYDVKAIDWALVLFFAVCTAIRLARFNVDSIKKARNPVLEKYFFKGIPSPVGGLLAILPMILYFEFDEGFYTKAENVVAYVASIAVLMASRVPTISIKKIPIRTEFIYLTMMIICLLAIGLIIKPWLTLIFIGSVYFFSIPITIFVFIRIQLRSYVKNKKRGFHQS